MSDEGFKRKLTAVLSADAVEYSRLMAEDEAATVKTIASYREIMSSLIKQHRGRVVDSPGDNVLAEFSSVVDAVQCAVAVQNEIQTKNADLPDNRRMEFRIGVNLGDVIDEEDRLYGDGVNIAARLESLADPGGICVSKTAFDQIETKLPLGYEYLGEQSVKNIPKPVGAYRVLMKPDAAGKVIGENRFLGKFSRKSAMSAIIILIAVAGALVSWNIYLQQSKQIAPASVDKMAFPLPDKPSIAVLPFDYLSGDPQHAFLADSISENIMSNLSKIPRLFVIARNSTFTYKGKPIKVQQVSEELGVRYVLEGSVQKSGDRLRVTAQLIDAIKGNHLWSETYDRDMNDIFQVQDAVTKEITTALNVTLTQGEQARLLARGTDNLEAYMKAMQARENIYRHDMEGNILARQLAQKAIDLDPQYSQAYRLLGVTHMHDVLQGRSKSPKESMGKAIKLVKKAIALDNQNGYTHAVLGFLLILIGQYDKAVSEVELGAALFPNNADVHGWLGMVYRYVGRWEEAVHAYEQAIRLNPIPPNYYLFGIGQAYAWTGRYEEAITACEKAISEAPKSLYARVIAAMVYSMSGRDKEARAQAAEVLRINPKFSLNYWAKRLRFKNQDDNQKHISALRNAGLPE